MDFFAALLLPALANAHIASFGPGMYCKGGLTGENNQNNNLPVAPLYQLTKDKWWFQHDRGCDTAPPPAGEFLDLPVGENFTVEHGNNQAFTMLSYGGKSATDWPDGGQHPTDWHGEWENSECMPGGGWMHATNQSDTQGTAFAIAYESDLAKIQMEDLVVFSVLEHTPWNRLATYQVPAGLPACPPGGCTCAHLWIAKGCGQANMYMQGFKCNTTGAVGTKTLAKAQPPVFCEDDQGNCRKGAKQMIVFNQAEGNDVPVPDGATPVYNVVAGFMPGAQDDIFEPSGAPSSPSTMNAATSISPVLSVSTHIQAPTSSIRRASSTSSIAARPASNFSTRSRPNARPTSTRTKPFTSATPRSTSSDAACSAVYVTVTVTDGTY